MALRLLLTLILLTAGCSVAPPTPLERDPDYRGLAENEPLGVRLAVAPVTHSYRRGENARRYAGVRTAEPTAWSAREYAWNPTLPADRLQSRVARLMTWAFHQPSTPVLQSRSIRELRADCERSGAELFLDVDLRGCRVTFVDHDGLWWWGNLGLFYGLGIPVPFIADEVYEVELKAHVSVVHARSGRRILSKELHASHRRALNEPQRGWSLSGLLFLKPWLLDEDDFSEVYTALYPHARKDLERRLVGWLRTALPNRLANPAVDDLVKAGPLGRARTYALVIGANGPVTDDIDRPRPLKHAETDAADVARELLASRTVASPRHIETLVGLKIEPDQVLAAIDRIGKRMLQRDRLIVFYAGFGRTDGIGAPALLLNGRPLPLARLAKQCTERLPAGSKVLYLLDTSFGGVRGRTYPSGRVPSKDRYLSELVSSPQWSVLTAAGPRNSALELAADRNGLFTAWLLSAFRHAASEKPTSLRDVHAFVASPVSREAKERVGGRQTPRLLGSPDFLLGPRPRRRIPRKVD